MSEEIDQDELEARAELKAMAPDQLFKVIHTFKKWHCCANGCDRFSRVRDFGMAPLYYFRGDWVDLSVFVLYCARHWKLHKKNPDWVPDEGFKPGRGSNHLTE